jgi:hypothetical protein
MSIYLINMDLPADCSTSQWKLKIWNTIREHEMLILSFRTTDTSHKRYQSSVARSRTNLYQCTSRIRKCKLPIPVQPSAGCRTRIPQSALCPDQRSTNFTKNIKDTFKFEVPKWWQKASLILRAHNSDMICECHCYLALFCFMYVK